jgi:hypothetical protein
MLLFYIASLHAQEIRGRVLDSTSCRGIPNLVVRLTPPTSSAKPVVVTATNDDGAFRADLAAYGAYYVALYNGTQQVYGRVHSLSASAPLTITLSPAKSQSVCPTDAFVSRLSSKDIDNAIESGIQEAKGPSLFGPLGLGSIIAPVSPKGVLGSVGVVTDQTIVAMAAMRASRRGSKLAPSQVSSMPLNGLLVLFLAARKQFPKIPDGTFPVTLSSGGTDLFPASSASAQQTLTYVNGLLHDLGYDYSSRKKWLEYAFAVPQPWWNGNIEIRISFPNNKPEILGLNLQELQEH